MLSFRDKGWNLKYHAHACAIIEAKPDARAEPLKHHRRRLAPGAAARTRPDSLLDPPEHAAPAASEKRRPARRLSGQCKFTRRIQVHYTEPIYPMRILYLNYHLFIVYSPPFPRISRSREGGEMYESDEAGRAWETSSWGTRRGRGLHRRGRGTAGALRLPDGVCGHERAGALRGASRAGVVIRPLSV